MTEEEGENFLIATANVKRKYFSQLFDILFTFINPLPLSLGFL